MKLSLLIPKPDKDNKRQLQTSMVSINFPKQYQEQSTYIIIRNQKSTNKNDNEISTRMANEKWLNKTGVDKDVE